MGAGVQIFNDSNIIQIDEFYRNMVLTLRGAASTARPSGSGTNPYGSAYYARISYPVSSRQPVLALRSSGYVCFLADDSGFTVFSFGASVSFDYYVYDRVDFGAAAGNTGVQVFNEQGIETFNSNNQYMKVLGSYAVSLVVPNIATNPATVPVYDGSVAAGKTLAVCMGVQNTGYYVSFSGTGQPGVAVINVRYWQCQVVTPAANTFRLANTIIHSFGGPSAPGQDEGAVASYNSGLIVDVTGL